MSAMDNFFANINFEDLAESFIFWDIIHDGIGVKVREILFENNIDATDEEITEFVNKLMDAISITLEVDLNE